MILAVLATSARPASAATVCQSFGADTDCGTIITITNTGATVSSTGQGPYDGIEDTLVGVVNKSRLKIQTLQLKASANIFGFDGDGIDTFGAPGNSRDSTGYGGPNSYFTNINASQTVGRVNFVTPLAANGGSTYFSLEESISSAVSCQTLINKAVSTPVVNGADISATFTPKLGFSLKAAAKFCGFTDFDWQQRITSWPLPSPLFQQGNPNALHAPPPFLDPAPGGYTYQAGPDNSYPFYYDKSGELATHQTATTMSFEDLPSDPCLFGGSGHGCGGKTAPSPSVLAFTTHLAGVNSDGSATDLKIGFSWTSTFNGTSGGVATTKNSVPADPGSSTGGVTVTSVQDTTDYQFNGVSVTSVNPSTITGSHPGAIIADGSTTVINAQVGGAIDLNQGASLDLEQSTVNGAIVAATSPGDIRICDTTIAGHVTISGATGTVFLGVFGDPTCGPNNFLGGISVQ